MADHDAHGPGGARGARRRRRLRAVRALGRRAAAAGRADVAMAVQRETKYIVHFPETREIWSYGSGYGGNALLGKKCFALRIASAMARDEGWLAEHMLILKLDLAGGRGQVRRRRIPVGVRQDQPRDADSDDPGLEGRDDRRRHRVDQARRGRPPLRDQSRGGLLRRRARARARRPTPTRWRRSRPDTIFTNAPLTDDGDIWWEGMTDEPPAHLIDWQGKDWTPGSGTPRRPSQRALQRRRRAVTRRSHPSGRTRPACRSTPSSSAAAARAPCRSSTRRSTGSTASFSARRWARKRRPPPPARSASCAAIPFAMLPFCGYNMADYFAHWLNIGREHENAKLPRIFYVNWFRKDPDGRFLWPGYGENSACWRGSSAAAKASPKRSKPPPDSHQNPRISTSPASTSPRRLSSACSTSTRGELAAELPQLREHLAHFGDRLPDRAPPPARRARAPNRDTVISPARATSLRSLRSRRLASGHRTGEPRRWGRRHLRPRQDSPARCRRLQRSRRPSAAILAATGLTRLKLAG